MIDSGEYNKGQLNLHSASFMKMFSRLKIVVLEVEDWIILQRSKFDIVMDGEPYPALQLYLNTRTGMYLTRVWGKTYRSLKGEINPESWAEIEDLCDQIFSQGLKCCPGNMKFNADTEIGSLTINKRDDKLITVEYPFKRVVSTGCTVFNMADGPIHDSPLAVCSDCRVTVTSETNAKKELEEEVKAFESHFPEVKVEELPDSKQADAVNSLFEQDFSGNFNSEVKDNGTPVEEIDKHEPEATSPVWTSREGNKRRAREKVQESLNLICEICGKIYNNRDVYYQHIRAHRQANSTKCSHSGCGLIFKTIDEKKLHENSAHQVTCDICGIVSKNQNRLRSHMHQVHVYKVPCEKCGKLYKSKVTLREHVELVHEKKPPRGKKCTECELVFPFFYQMNIHRNKVHFPTKYQCERCQCSYGNGQILKKHLMHVHSGERNFSCHICGTKLKKASDLRDHMRAHSGEKPFACQYCHYRGSSKSLLYHHKKQKHKTEFEEEKKEKEKAKIKICGGL